MTTLPLHVHLLVVDDDDVDRERVLRLLSRTALKFDAMEASSSTDALNLLRRHEFDCVMLDNQLGDASGAELLPAIHREALRDCPVIMITGAGNESLAVQALQDGAADYLTKFQLNPDTLVRAIGRALEHHRMRRELDDLHHRLEQRVEQQAASIRQSERDLRAILDHTPTVISYWDAELRNRFANRAFRRLLGVDPERMPGRLLPDVLGPQRLARIMPLVQAVLRGEAQFKEQDLLAPDGLTQRHTQISLHPDLGDDGKVRGFYASINDVTPIKQAQARAEELAAFNEALFDHSPVGLAVYDDEGRCVRVNHSLMALTGGQERDLVGQTLHAITEDDVLPLAATGRATLADGLPRRLDLDIHTLFGKHLLASCAWARVERDGRGQLLLALQDTTEQRRAHDALVAARNAAEQATRTKSEFLANMSHEIRTPMNAIVGLTQLALQDTLPPESHNFIDKAHGAARALMGILDDVLDYSKVEAGQLRIEHLPLDIEQVVQRSVDLFSARIGQKGLSFLVDLSPALPRCVLGDPLRLSQVLNNLLGNAVKFTERGHIHLSVRPLSASSPNRDMYRFAVRDSGIGVDPAHRDALFEAFAQGDGSISRRFGGTGLGLTICRRLVIMMHGTIGFESVPGVGSEFWFTARLDRSPVELPDDGSDALAGLRVLLAEPDARVATWLGERLQGWQVQATLAHDLPGLLQHLGSGGNEGRSFDALFIDMAHLGEDAADGLRTLRQACDPRRRPLLVGMAAAIGRPVGAARNAEGTPDLLVGKPVLPAALRRALLQVVDQLRDRDRAQPAPAEGQPGPSERQAVAQRQEPLAGVRTLLVEDNDTNRLVARVFLERLGATVQTAGDGAEALARLKDGDDAPLDVVLMDLHMPVMDGLEATRRIHALPGRSELPIIGMTAAAMVEDRTRCFAAGMVDYVTKPIVVEQLIDVLLHWTGRRKRPDRAPVEVDLPGFDLTALRDLLRGDVNMMWRLLHTFGQQEADTAAEVAALVVTDDHEQACRLLHRLRGTAGTLGALQIAKTSLELEQALRQHRPVKSPLAAFTESMRIAMGALRDMGEPPDHSPA
jgi:PAS domain S-box-containing protein